MGVEVSSATGLEERSVEDGVYLREEERLLAESACVAEGSQVFGAQLCGKEEVLHGNQKDSAGEGVAVACQSCVPVKEVVSCQRRCWSGVEKSEGGGG